MKKESHNSNAIHLTVSSSNNKENFLEEVTKILEDNAATVILRRHDESDSSSQSDFFVDFDSFEKLNTTKRLLKELNPEIQLSFLENRIL